jgi:hypothetical protein
VFALAGGYLVARLAPNAPMGHVLVLGLIGACLAMLGAIASIPMQLGPAWLPIVLAVSALPLTWLGGSLAVRAKGERA